MNHYAGVFVFDPLDGMVLCVSDASHPNEFKMAGGMSVNSETPRETVYREATEELRTRVLASTLVLVETVPNKGGLEHKRYFFLADKVSGALEKGSRWAVKEEGPGGKVNEKLTAQWVPLREFADKLFFKQHPAFGAILMNLACRDSEFCDSFADLITRFPEPENLGLEGVKVD